jgi:hypothetical protein
LLGVKRKMIGVRQQDMRHGSPRIFTRLQFQHALAAAVRARRLNTSNTLRPVKRSVDLPAREVVAEL